MSSALPNKPLFRVDEVANYCDVAKTTIYTWHQMGLIKTVKTPGRTIRIRRDEVLRILTSSTE